MRGKFQVSINPDDMTAGQLADLIKQRDNYLSELGLARQNYMPFEQVPQPQPTKSENLEQKLQSFYRFVEEAKEQDRKQKQVNQSREQSNETFQVQSLAQSEMGVKADGQAYNFGSLAGLGFQNNQDEDAYSKFRRQKSQQYHSYVEERQKQKY
ncbi:hypothetical protein pb186bvf_007143 [Paramecium bursaria]